MTGPVLSSISSQWEVLDVVTVNAIVQSEKDTKACLCKDRMRSLELNVILRDISDGFRKPSRCQEFLDGEVRKLGDPRIPILDYDLNKPTTLLPLDPPSATLDSVSGFRPP